MHAVLRHVEEKLCLRARLLALSPNKRTSTYFSSSPSGRATSSGLSCSVICLHCVSRPSLDIFSNASWNHSKWPAKSWTKTNTKYNFNWTKWTNEPVNQVNDFKWKEIYFENKILVHLTLRSGKVSKPLPPKKNALIMSSLKLKVAHDGLDTPILYIILQIQ